MNIRKTKDKNMYTLLNVLRTPPVGKELRRKRDRGQNVVVHKFGLLRGDAAPP